jgi:hypothetical protein
MPRPSKPPCLVTERMAKNINCEAPHYSGFFHPLITSHLLGPSVIPSAFSKISQQGEVTSRRPVQAFKFY